MNHRLPIDDPQTRPALLMLSHCLPEETGSGERRRAWELLSLASRTHRVWLACLLDAPVRLDQWRAAHALAHRIAIEPPPALRLPKMAWLGRRGTNERPLIRSVRGWLEMQAFKTALATAPRLATTLDLVEAGVRLCDGIDTITPMKLRGLAMIHHNEEALRQLAA